VVLNGFLFLGITGPPSRLHRSCQRSRKCQKRSSLLFYLPSLTLLQTFPKVFFFPHSHQSHFILPHVHTQFSQQAGPSVYRPSPAGRAQQNYRHCYSTPVVVHISRRSTISEKQRFRMQTEPVVSQATCLDSDRLGRLETGYKNSMWITGKLIRPYFQTSYTSHLSS
jgi:hypothetical protein